ncbi:MAG: hypothetical protein ACI9DJ_002400 [Algoriphagus sp.]|jgi:hypothetical protein
MTKTYTFFRTLVSILVFIVSASAVLHAHNKRALIVAIGDYPEESNWGKISANNDTLLLKKSLSKQNFKDITVLSDAAATKERIIK